MPGKLLLSDRPFDGDGRIRVELRMGPGGMAALAWCRQEAHGAPRYFLLEIHDREDALGIQVHACAGDESRRLQETTRPQSRREILGWHELGVVITGPVVTCFVDDRDKPIQLLLDRENRGAIGFFVSGATDFYDPVHFRNLSVETFARVE